MTLFNSECQNLQYMSMADDQKSTRSKLRGVKRPGSAWYGSEFELEYDCYEDNLYERVYDHQRVPSTVSPLSYSSNGKQLCSTSSSLSSRRCSRERLSSRSSRPQMSSRAKLKMEELQTIKRELTVIKMQIDGLLDSLERMDRQRQESTASPLSQNESLGGSLSHPSASSPEVSPRSLSPRCWIHRDSPELGEASDEETVHTLFSTIPVNILVTQSGRPKSIRNRLPREAFHPRLFVRF